MPSRSSLPASPVGPGEGIRNLTAPSTTDAVDNQLARSGSARAVDLRIPQRRLGQQDCFGAPAPA
jgi:hypothetical protein